MEKWDCSQSRKYPMMIMMTVLMTMKNINQDSRTGHVKNICIRFLVLLSPILPAPFQTGFSLISFALTCAGLPVVFCFWHVYIVP